MDYKEALEFIHGRPRLRKKPTLERMQVFLNRLDDPQNEVTAVHVGGTNGKGSTVAFLGQMIESTDHSVGTFTSPFLERFNERIAVNGIPIRDDEIVELVEKIKPIVDQMDQTEVGGPLEFEIVTAMMFVYFQTHPVDIVLIEVGIGGKYDSTNVFIPVVSVITNVDWDHMDILGDTLTKIAEQKAGIIKAGVPVVTGSDIPEVITVLQKQAQQLHSKVFKINQDFRINDNNGDFTNSDLTIKHLQSGLKGVHQLKNLAVAIQVMLILVQKLKWDFDINSLKSAIQNTRWAGRMEVVQQKPMVVLDGAHNLPGIQALGATIQKEWPQKHVHILAAILDDKLFNAMLDELSKLKFSEITLTSFKGPLKRNVVDTSELNFNVGSKVEYEKNWKIALDQIIKRAELDDLIVITGSLYFIAEVRPELKKPF